jgi:hypothetical protein
MQNRKVQKAASIKNFNVIEHAGIMKKSVIVAVAAIFFEMMFAACGSTHATKKVVPIKPAFIIKPNESIAIMPFQAESVLSNLGSQVSDEVIVNLLERAPDLKIFPATVVRHEGKAQLPVFARREFVYRDWRRKVHDNFYKPHCDRQCHGVPD